MSTGLARLIVFFTSASVLVIEILAVRLVAPYLGVSLETFTGVIGVILAGIAFGAWAGGRAADRSEPSRLLGPLLIAGGAAALVSPLITDALGPAIGTDAFSIIALTFFSFFAPAALLSAVAPVVVKIQLGSLDETGSVVGSYSAVGTFGALVGTFVTGFILIAAFPTRPMVAALGVILIVGGLLLATTRRTWTVAVVLVGGLLATTLVAVGSPCDYETTYHCAFVESDPDNPNGRTLILDRLRNSYVDIEDPTHLEFRYLQTMANVVDVTQGEGPLAVVSIGGGGFTYPGFIEATRLGSQNIVYEIDSSLDDIARAELALHEKVEVVEVDARGGLAGESTDSADVVVGDAFSGLSVPWHLTTEEFVIEIDRILRPEGVYVMNLIDYADFEFLRSTGATLRKVFPEVVLFGTESAFVDGRGGNFVFAASRSTIDAGTVLARTTGSSQIALQGPELAEQIGDASVLTDDFAPVDQMLGNRS